MNSEIQIGAVMIHRTCFMSTIIITICIERKMVTVTKVLTQMLWQTLAEESY